MIEWFVPQVPRVASRGVELDTIGHAAGRSKDGRLLRTRIVFPDMPRFADAVLIFRQMRESDVAEVHCAIGR